MHRFATILLCALAAASAASGEQNLNRWLKAGGEIRGRAEGYTALGYAPGRNDAYYLNRLRLSLSVEPRPWLKFYVQGQDSRAPAYQSPAPGSVVNPLDLRQAYVEAGRIDKGPWALRAGRQELSFGEERLVGVSNWTNTARTFDALRLSRRGNGMRLDWFASAVVAPERGGFDRPRTAVKFYGFYSSFDRLIDGSAIEPYLLWKTDTLTRSERGQPGDLDVYTAGLRAAGRLPLRFDYSLEIAVQSGHAATDDVRAWAGHWRAGYKTGKDDKAPRLIAEYNFASGDKKPGDGRRATFDQLYPTNHYKYGIADRVGWRNIKDAMAGIEWKPTQKWKLNLDYHAFWLATRADGLYGATGARTVFNPLATSSHVGNELDFQASCRVTPRLSVGFGYARLFAGEYLRQSSRGSGVTFPYVMWEYKL